MMPPGPPPMPMPPRPPPPMAPRPRAPPPPAAPPAVDVSGLFASIAAAGLLPGGGALPPPRRRRRRRGRRRRRRRRRVPAGGGAHTADAAQHAMVFKMYDARPLVCKASALRFEAGDEEGLRKHMDYLFRRNRRGKVKGGAPPSRRWFQGVDSWVSSSSNSIGRTTSTWSRCSAAGPPGGKADDEVEGGGGGGDGGAAVEACDEGAREVHAARMLPVRRGDPALLGRGERGVDAARRRQRPRRQRAHLPLGMRRRLGLMPDPIFTALFTSCERPHLTTRRTRGRGLGAAGRATILKILPECAASRL